MVRLGHHPGAHRVQLDVAAARQEIGPGVHKACLVPPLPERPRAAVTSIEQPGVVAGEGMHQPRDRARLVRRQQRVDVIAHQDVGVQTATEARHPIPQTLQIPLPILVIEKTRQPIVASLHDVLRDIGQVETREPCHGRQFRSLPHARRSGPTAHPLQSIPRLGVRVFP